ncbi:MAG: 6-phosphogluconolactonase [Acidiferrobacteraceae bacterium]
MAQRHLGTPPQTRRWYVYADSDALTRTLSRTLLDSAAEAVAQRGAFHLVLAGGSTPRTLYRLLAQADADWHAWHIYFAVHDAPKPPPERISLSASRLGRARQVWFLVTGAGKREAMERWREGEDIPAAHIRPMAGVEIHMDSEAAPSEGMA